jgi:hypothetical protein
MPKARTWMPENPGLYIGWGFAQIDATRLDFWLAYDPAALIQGLGLQLPEPPDDDELLDGRMAWDSAAADAATSLARTVDPSSPVQVRVEIHPKRYEGPATGGAGGIEGELLRFLLSDDPIGRLADVLGIAAFGLAVKSKFAAVSSNAVGISDGFAVVEVARTIDAKYGARATTLLEAIHLHPSHLDKMNRVEGYLTVLRDDAWVYLVVVSFHGEVLDVSRMAVSGFTPEPDQDEPLPSFARKRSTKRRA